MIKENHQDKDLCTVPVKSRPPNQWGLYGMHGNVAEWVQDAWHDNYNTAPDDGSAWEPDGAGRVLRGGSWYDIARGCRSACRGSLLPDDRLDDIGFRFARVQFGKTDAMPGTGTPPPWADAWGLDGNGAWADFSVESLSAEGGGNNGNDNGQRITQRMRWMEPGGFLMGSPETEEGRFEDESPQHRVDIKSGFWMFDTTVTQALWAAVMGGNPSHFKGTDLPVERVSWDDAQKFIQVLNQKLPGLDLGLPSEAQWEYACRAGTTTPFSFGDNLTLDQANQRGGYVFQPPTSEIAVESPPVETNLLNPFGL